MASSPFSFSPLFLLLLISFRIKNDLIHVANQLCLIWTTSEALNSFFVLIYLLERPTEVRERKKEKKSDVAEWLPFFCATLVRMGALFTPVWIRVCLCVCPVSLCAAACVLFARINQDDVDISRMVPLPSVSFIYYYSCDICKIDRYKLAVDDMTDDVHFRGITNVCQCVYNITKRVRDWFLSGLETAETRTKSGQSRHGKFDSSKNFNFKDRKRHEIIETFLSG